MPSLPRLVRVVTLLALFALTGCSRDDPALWQRVDGRWAYDGQAFDAADAASLAPLDGRFARDAVQGYYRGTPVRGSHGPSFEVLGENEARDRHAVYWADTYRKGQEYYTVRHVRVAALDGADPARYEVLRHGYGRDGRHAWREGLLLHHVRDAASFEVLTPRLSRDARRAYFEDAEIPDSDGASFEIVDAGDPAWVRGRQRAWHVGHTPAAGGEPPRREVRLLERARADSLRPLGRGYANDGRRVWWRGRLLKDADAASFGVADDAAASAPSDGADARDARGAFRQGRRVAVAVETNETRPPAR